MVYLYTKMKLQDVEWGGIEWIALFQATDRWRTLELSGSIEWGKI
jgi:hypothetical protein